jgi:2'-5' RNA ligase
MRNDGVYRLFLAIDPPDEINGNIVRIQSRLQRIITGDVRWVKPGGVHLTLKFFGDVPARELEKIAAASVKAAAAADPFTLSLRGLGVFPSARRPRVLYLGIEGETTRLTSFQNKLEAGLCDCGFPREERQFLPHLTLARIKSLREPDRLLKELEGSKTYEAGQFTVSELRLIKSDLTPGGAVYTQLAGFPLAG